MIRQCLFACETLESYFLGQLYNAYSHPMGVCHVEVACNGDRWSLVESDWKKIHCTKKRILRGIQ